MATCPNKNLDSWNNLVTARGEDVAYYLWDKYDGNVPESESKSSIVKAGLKSVNALQSTKAEQVFNTLQKNKVTGDAFWNKIQSDLQIPKEQIDLLKQYNTTDREQLITNMLADYSFAIEIDTTTSGSKRGYNVSAVGENEGFELDGDMYDYFPLDNLYYKNQENITKEEYEKAKNKISGVPTQYYSNLTVPGGTNYTENEIATPAITPSIKGHAQFATNKGIGWFRSDDKMSEQDTRTLDKKVSELSDVGVSERDIEGGFRLDKGEGSKTRRILEVQSDLFQKGRDKEQLYDQELPYYEENNIIYGPNLLTQGEDMGVESKPTQEEIDRRKREAKYFPNDQFQKKNQFLQLLNKDNNWVNFFVKSIIQDSAKKGYEKVLFPSGNTASKVEGHTTLEEYKKQKEDRIKLKERELKNLEDSYVKPVRKITKEDIKVVAVNSLEIRINIKGNDYLIKKPIGYDEKTSVQIGPETITIGSGTKFPVNELEKGGQRSRIVGADKFAEMISNKLYELQLKKVSIKDKQTTITNEINQLKKELERVEKEGFGALKPIYNFYENTVANVLKKQGYVPKQVTDEYGNTWNEVSLKEERDTQKVLFQLGDMAMSTASKETLDKVKEAAKKMGISIQDLADYAKSNPEIDTKSVNGVADLVRGVIAVATGRENVALTEEMVHIATAILEQTNPQMVTAMISKIDRFKIYKTTFEKYKNNKAYQLANGKPNVRKIKKEAVDKLIAELIINNNQGSTDFPELLEEQPKSMIKGWWQAILDFVRRKYSSSNIDIFREAAKVVISGEVGGTIADIKDTGVFYQVVEKNELVDKIYDKYIDIDKRMQLVPGVGNEKRHYTLDGKKIAMSVTEKVKAESSKNMPERTDMEKRQDEQKRDWGSEGHRFVEEYISAALIDENGYARPQALDVTLSTNINLLVQKKLMDFAKELIASYKPGTRFLIEKKVVNQNVKGMLASTIDFIAIEPITKKDGTKDVKVDILDWKFTNVNKERDDDVPWPKQLEWKAQMGEYSKMAYSTYGIQRNQLRKTRMIPFQSNYVYNIPGDKTSGLHLQSIEVGKLDSTTETNLYLLPVPLNSESTGNDKIDRLLASLRQQYEKIYTAPPDPKKKFLKDITLKQLERAIRKLHLQLDFEPLAAVGETFVNNAKESLKEFENLDFTKLSKDGLMEKLKTLLEYQKSAEKYSRIDEVFLAVYSEEGLFDDERKTLNSLRNTTFATRSFLERIEAIQKAFTVQIALKEGITTEATKESVLKAEREADWLSKTFLEASKLSQKIIKLSANLIMNARSAQNIEANKVINEFGKLLTPLEQQAAAQGKSAFDLIGTSTGGKLSLIKKLKKEFWEQIDLAKKSRDLEFLKKNMDVEKYNEMIKEVIAEKEEILNRTVFSTDAEENKKQLDYRIRKLKDSLDINRKTFNGYEGYDFAIYFNKAINEEIEENLSPEYVKLRNNPAAFAMWKFMVGLNEKARDMGYLKKKGMSFFPLMEASVIDKIGQTSDAAGQVKDFFNDIYTARINERPGFAKIDPETGRLKKQIPKLFTQTDRDVSMLSKDLNKVGVLWINALFQYQTSKQLEDTLLTLHQVEKNKGHIIVDENGDIVFESGDPKIDERSNKNADILETIIDDAVYGIKDDLSSLGNKLISAGAGVTKKDAEQKQETAVSVKKTLNNANKLVQALAVGLKPMIAVANYFGVNFQSFINAGRFYNYSEYTKNNIKVTTGTGITTIDKGLIDLIFPLNEDLTKEKRRQLAKENSYIKYLSTWTFSDVMMITNSWGERKLQLSNALSFNENSMVVDGKIVNIRQYLQKQDSQAKKTMTEIERRDLERTFEDRVSKLKESSSLNKVAVIENDQVVIPGVSVEELAKYRTKVIEFGRNLNGQMSQDNRAAYRRDTILSSFMMFKNWIPKLLGARILDIQKNTELDEWEYGRVRLFIKTMMGVANYNLLNIREIISGSDKGLRLMDQLLEAKRAEYFAKTGQQLEITPEEFYDMTRKELSNLAKEAGLVFGMLGILIAAKVAAPDNDEDDLTKNRYKWLLKQINKITDELIFYYNPMSFESITTGSVFPAFNLTVQAEKFARNVIKEGYGEITGDEELIEKAHPTKYFLNMIPGAAQFQNEVLPYINPELAKEIGIRVTAESRRR